MKLPLTLALALVLALGSRTARADGILTYTFNTQVATPTTGLTIDGLGLFGPAGADLTGVPATLVFMLDLSKGIKTQTLNFNPDYQVAETTDLASLGVTASLTINGKTVSSPFPNDKVGSSEIGITRGSNSTLPTYANVTTTSASCLYICDPGVEEFFTFNRMGDAYSLAFFDDVGTGARGTDLTFVPVNPTITPEPSSLLLLATGLLGGGALLRRRRMV